jgi:hypothetical protein
MSRGRKADAERSARLAQSPGAALAKNDALWPDDPDEPTMYRVLIALRDGSWQVYRDSGYDAYSKETAEMLARHLRRAGRTVRVEP